MLRKPAEMGSGKGNSGADNETKFSFLLVSADVVKSKRYKILFESFFFPAMRARMQKEERKAE